MSITSLPGGYGGSRDLPQSIPSQPGSLKQVEEASEVVLRGVLRSVLWLWKDAEMMVALYEQCNQSKVRWEIDRLVLDLERKPHR